MNAGKEYKRIKDQTEQTEMSLNKGNPKVAEDTELLKKTRKPYYGSGYTVQLKRHKEKQAQQQGQGRKQGPGEDPGQGQGQGPKFGVAFSGGGIRSAAFCSGVLRRLIGKEKEPDYLSCVSGGGYTGSAYVQWKYHKGQAQGPAQGQAQGQGPVQEPWTDDFFIQMRKNSGYFCNWHKGCFNGCMDSIILIALVVFVAIIAPIAGWGSFACPIAFLVKLLYGKFLDGTLCRVNDGDSVDCRERTTLFACSIGIFLVFHFLEYLLDCCENSENYQKMRVPKVLLKLGQIFSGATFAFTFFPWFIEDFLQYTHLVIRLAILVFTVVFWFSVPLLRKYSSLVLLIYAYSYVVYWHLYKGTFFGIKYTEARFQNCTIVSLVLLGVFSVLGEFPRRLVHVYNRWRLQKAFYNPNQHNFNELKEPCCYCYDIFPGGHCSECTCCLSCNCPPSRQTVLTLDKLKDTKPLFISSMVANGWRREYKKKYCPLVMSPKGWLRALKVGYSVWDAGSLPWWY